MLKFLSGVMIVMSTAHAWNNHLVHEESPYLQQHAHNPVDWYPWSEAAFAKAKKEHKLIFLSIGYATCHWCHVMERESFENEKIAEYMNAHFVNIKVDREELPHIDRYFQDVYLLLNRRAGGWPLSIFMTPDAKPFYAATYLPPDNRYGRPGLLGIAQYLWETYRDKPENVRKSAESIEAAMRQVKKKEARIVPENVEGEALARAFVEGVAKQYDDRYKGIGDAPKFPHATTLGTLLDIFRLTGNEKAKRMAIDALEAMAKGGIFDQIEGGFYRYSVDARWEVPHFEKMLYTNAELLEVCANAWLLTKEPLFADVVTATVDNITRRFEQDGLYLSASDADSDGEEGKYFLYAYTPAMQALTEAGLQKEQAEAILNYLGITKEGNFEGKSNPHIRGAKKPQMLEKGLEVLRKMRQTRTYPFIDYKIQTSWNALWCKALLKASVLDQTYVSRATDTLEKIWQRLYRNGQLYHQVVSGKEPKVKGYLEDYAFLTAALIEAYQQTHEEKWLQRAIKLQEEAVRKFYEKGVWYMSDTGFKTEASVYDSAYRSASAVMVGNLFELAILTENRHLHDFAVDALTHLEPSFANSAQNFPTLTDVWLGYRYGWILIKGKKEILTKYREKIAFIQYPFLRSKAHHDEKLLACRIDRCFAAEEKMEHLLEKIE